MSLLAALLRPYRELGPDDTVSGWVLSRDPPIILTKPRPKPFGPAPTLARRHPGRPLVVLRQLTWSFEGWDQALLLAAHYHRHRRAHPAVRLIVLANTEREVARLAGLGVEVVLASSNMFLDETLFRPLPDATRRFDAIYNAQMNPYKRHHLSFGVGSCAHVTYLPTFMPAPRRRARIAAFRAAAPAGHVVLNAPADDNFRPMREGEVNAAYNEAWVGLCLSRVEGQMYASVEYQLAGLPVVTTRNRGGRDRYLDPETSLTVADDPRAVREGVEALAARAIPPDVVRARVMARMTRDRAAFNAFVEGLAGGPTEPSDPRWSFRYVHKLVAQIPFPLFEAQLDGRA